MNWNPAENNVLGTFLGAAIIFAFLVAFKYHVAGAAFDKAGQEIAEDVNTKCVTEAATGSIVGLVIALNASEQVKAMCGCLAASNARNFRSLIEQYRMDVALSDASFGILGKNPVERIRREFSAAMHDQQVANARACLAKLILR